MQRSTIIEIKIIQINEHRLNRKHTPLKKDAFQMLTWKAGSQREKEFLEVSVPEQFEFLIPELSIFQRIRSQFFTVPILINDQLEIYQRLKVFSL